MSKIFFIVIICLSFNIIKLEEDTRSDDIVIIHTNDVHCGIQDAIGYDGIMLYKKQLLNKYKHVFLVDCGDHIQGGTIGTITEGEEIILIMNELGYDVVTLGNHEFDYGIDTLENCAGLLNCSYISSNYRFKKNKTNIYPTYKILDAGTKKIGFVGVTTPQTLTKSLLITLLDENGDYIYDFLTEGEGEELFKEVQKIIDELKNDKGVDYVIILAHLGKDGDAIESYKSVGLLKNLKNVDALLDGHSHQVYSTSTSDKDSKDVILAQTGTKINNIGVLTIHVNNNTMSHEILSSIPIIDENYNLSTVENVTTKKGYKLVDKEMYDYLAIRLELLQEILGIEVGYAPFELSLNADPQDPNSPMVNKYNESSLCNLVADALRDAGEGDVCIINAGTVRKSLGQGNITFQELIDIMPFSNDIQVIKVSGQDILDALEFGVKELPGITSRFPQVSGITYKIDTSINSSVVIDENEAFIGINGERRVYDVKVGGEDIDPKKNYTMSTHNFIIQGGDGYSMFPKCEILKDSLGVDNLALIDYIDENLNGTISEKYRTAEGRIIKTDGKVNNTDNTNNINNTDSTDSTDSTDDINTDNNSQFQNLNYRKSSSGLSTGAICAIAIPCAVVVLAALIASFALKKSPNEHIPTSSVSNLSTNNI